MYKRNKYNLFFLLLFLLIVAGCQKQTEQPAITGSDNPVVNQDTRPPEEEHKIILHVNKLKADPSRRQQSMLLNKQGLEMYKEGRIEDAASFFRASILEDSTYLYSHYNLACMISLLLGKGQQIDETELYDELAIALGLNAVQPGEEKDWVIKRMKVDTDLDPIRTSDAFQALFTAEKPEKLKSEELLLGKWTNGRRNNLEFKHDTYVYKKTSFGDNHNNQNSEGSWKFDEAAGRYMLTGDSFAFTWYDPDTNTEKEAATGILEFDLSRLKILLIHNEAEYDQGYYEIIKSPDSGIELYKKISPLHEAFHTMNVLEIAGLVGQDIIPDYSCWDCSNPGYPLQFAVQSKRIALIRLFVGKEGVWPYPEMYISDQHPHYQLIEEYRQQCSKTLLSRIAMKTKFSIEWYRDLFAKPINFPEERLYGGYASYNTFYALGSTYEYIAFINSYYVSSMPGNTFSIFMYDARKNRIVNNVTNIAISPGMSFPYDAMNKDDALIAAFIDQEKIWIPAVEDYDKFAISGVIPPIQAFPIEIRGESFDCILKSITSEPDDLGFSENLYTITFRDQEIGALSALDCKVLGYSLLSEDFPGYIIVFVSSLQRGFENESDSIIDVFSAHIGLDY